MAAVRIYIYPKSLQRRRGRREKSLAAACERGKLENTARSLALAGRSVLFLPALKVGDGDSQPDTKEREREREGGRGKKAAKIREKCGQFASRARREPAELVNERNSAAWH